MLSLSGSQVFLLLAVLNLTTSLPVRDEYEADARRPGSPPWLSDSLLEVTLRKLVSAGLDRRRQLGDIEFSNRYADFLRSKAKHNSLCAFLRRLQAVKRSAVGGDVEKINQLLRQYMCPSVYNSWPTDF